MADSQSDSNIFSVRIVSIDYYMAPPVPDIDICYSSFQGGKVNEVPVIRIYGSTPAGQKTCLHVHRALPYLYVPCSDLMLQPDQEGDVWTNVVSLALEKALKLKGNAGSKRQHVHDCSLVRAKKFYGYHSSEELFAKIYLYHPQDVSRAASLLLGGAVLDRILQPHESHIPFLLQFLVDYNLYGMGHLHVSKMKFRHPVPNVFSQREANDYNRRHRQQKDNSTCSAADFQADSSVEARSSSPIWVSSTIPDGWIWQSSSQLSSSPDNDIEFVKRQSTCELEGDAAVEEILNQQSMLFSSLSQTHSDVKMVQSLIPIWEEEFQRTGMHGPAMVSDPGKPLAKDVLRTLANGFEFEVKLMELLVTDTKNSSPCTPCENQKPFPQSMRSSTDEGNVVGFGHTNPKNNTRETPELSKASDGIGVLLSQESPCEEGDGAKHGKGSDACLRQLSALELQISDIAGRSQGKVADEEALRLLKWLASSQAAEDINSDDELACETILSPLLPTTTIDKVLEKANLDFESESQKECQDILDCVDDSLKIENLNGRPPQSTAEKIVTQVDGSGNDQHLIPPAGKSSEKEMNSESENSLNDLVNCDIGSSSNSKHKRKRRLWGSLPFSLTQKVNDDLQPISSNLTGRYDNDTKDGVVTCSKDGNEASIYSDAGKRKRFSREASTVVGCSVRDLMRRKRSHRVEPPECETPRGGKIPSEGESQKDAFLCTEQRADGQGVRAPSYSTPSSADELSEFHEKNERAKTSALEVCSEGQPNGPFMYGKLPLSSGSNDGNFPSSEGLDVVVTGETREENFEGLEVTTRTNIMESDNVGGEDHVMDTDASQPGSSVSMALPSVIQCTSGISGEPLLSSDVPNCPCPAGVENYEQTSVQDCVVDKCLDCREKVQHFRHRTTDLNFHEEGLTGVSTHYQDDGSDFYMLTPAFSPPQTDSVQKWLLNDGAVQDGVVDECHPFFEGDYQEGKEVENVRCGSCDLNYHQQGVMGIPTHYQNDGSYLYLLTPAFSPPSTDKVHKWLLNEGSGPSGNLVHPENPLADDFDEPLPESGSMPNVRPSLDQVNQQIQGSNNSDQMQPLHNEGTTTVLQREGTISKVKQGSGASQDFSQISGPDGKSKLTPLSQIGFQDPASVGAGQQLTLLSIEVQAESRGDLRSDPRFDAINLIVLIVQEDDDYIPDAYVLMRSDTEGVQRNIDGTTGCKVLVSSDEKHLFNHFIKIISSFDPDILIGWDIQGGSLGFLAERAAYIGIGLLNSISRTPSQSLVTAIDSGIPEKAVVKNELSETLMGDSVVIEDAIIEDEWGRTHASGVHVGGRIVLNVWRLMRSEVKLNIYTAEAVAEAVLRRKIPYIHCKVLTNWFSSGPGRARHRCIEYILERAKLNLELVNQLDMINRTSELARVFGIDFFSVLSRGSQYRVESMLLRLAHTQNYLAISPGAQQVASQPAMECLPLVMEPESSFYADPVVVLDFQSLYPSMIIAYNLCFSTCLGKVMPPNPNILGVSSYSPDPNILRDLKHEVLLTPNGVIYVPSKIRRGVLPRLLEEILSTRIMVKQAMKKLAPSQKVLNRIFNARQLALKLIANVTYGYTAAGFSGRMPCAELADSIVQCGRRTLESAISFVNTHDKWKAKVIYGDTDSMFVLLKGRSVEESFKIGYEIASAVSAMNPSPVTLKMEKVYHPCFLLTKKRYVGYSYESPDQLKPMFDAKGIETIRRDTCAAVSKTMEQSLRLFFEHQDIAKVKSYLLRQWTRILSGRVSLQDFIFAKEVRLGTYSTRTSSLPPAAIVATKAMRADPRAEPRYADRIPYVVVHGEPGARLVDMVVDPHDLLAIDSPFRLNDLYYINKQIIPALQRVFGLVSADLNQWFLDMPRPARESVGKRNFFAPNHHPHRTRIDYYYLSKHCVVCGELVQASAHLCDKCSKNNAGAATAVIGRTSKLERDIQHLAAICRHCGGGDWLTESGVKCTSLACSVFYERRKIQKELRSISAVATELGLYPRCMVEWF